MDSDDSRDDPSSGSESESENQRKEPQSPASNHSGSPRGPRSPSSDGSVQSNSPKQRSRSPVDNNSVRSPVSPDHQSPKSASSNSSRSSRSPVSLKGPRSPESPKGRSPKSPESPSHNNQTAHRCTSTPPKSPISPRSPRSPISPRSSKSRSPVSRNSYRSNHSRKSSLSPKSRDSSPRNSVHSNRSSPERGRPRSPQDDGHTSDSSDSSSDSCRKGKIRLDSQAEEISDGEMEYDRTKDSSDHEKIQSPKQKLNLSHEDLSDVSDLDSLGAASGDDEEVDDLDNKKIENSKIPQSPLKPPNDLRHKLDEAKNLRKMNNDSNKQMIINPLEKTSEIEDGEEQLDFEAEDGECIEDTKKDKLENDGELPNEPEEREKKPEKEVEEGEVTDDDEVRPEETEPRPVCRFYSRGQCTWGASCRFLHPGVTDKGNYTMFELIRPMVPGGPGGPFPPDYMDERPPGFGRPIPGEVPVAESAWERGLRTAKEMMRKAIKRKEQDMDFEEKKMNLTLAQEELDKENGYYTARAASPLPIEPVPRHYVTVNRHPVEYRPPPRVPPEKYYGRRVIYEEPPPRSVRVEPEYEVPRERVRYRELPPHRMPDYYNDKYEEPPASDKPRRTKREVIVHRVETGRGDEWADPWMRSKSPGARGKPARYSGGRRSYSSGSSYSSSSSSRSTSSQSYRGSRSRSRSPSNRCRRVKSPSTRRPPPSHHRNVSPSVIVSEKKAANERAALMNPPAPSPKKAHKDRPPSPGMMRTSAQNPPAPSKTGTDQYGRSRAKRDTEHKKLVVAAAIAASVKRRSRVSRSSSGSESSGSSSSDSESSYSSSSSSRDGSTERRRKLTDKMDLATIALKAKAMDVLKSTDKSSGKKKMIMKAPVGSKPVLDLRKADKDQLPKKRVASSPPSGESAPKIASLGKAAANNKKSTSRREELLKQLKAVEDAIAKKRSKI